MILSRVVLLAWLVAWAAPALAHRVPAEDGCRCAELRDGAGWCSHCGVGYVAGLRTESAALLEALDLPGHDVDPASLECAGCRAAAATDGICSSCGWGFARGRLHVSKLAWGLARARQQDPDSISCATCRAHARGAGWCESCRTGWIGGFAFADRGTWEEIEGEHQRLGRALTLLQRCESCAIAEFTGASCPQHGAPAGSANSRR